MAFVVKVLFLSALVYGTNAGYLDVHHNHHSHHNEGHHDSFLSSALSAPSASFGPPSQSYGPPAHPAPTQAVTVEETVVEDHGPVSSGASLPGIGGIAAAGITHGSNIAAPSGHHISGPISSGPGPIISSGPQYPSGPGPYVSGHGHYPSGPAPYPSGPGPYASGPGVIVSGPGPINGPGITYPSTDLSAPAPSGSGASEGSLILDSTLPGATGQIVGQTATVGAPRVIGTTVTVGRPDAASTRYELQSVVQNVIRRIPVEVTRHIQVSVPQPVPVPVRQEVKVPVPQPYPVHVDVVKHVPYPVYKTEHVAVERPVPYEVVKEVPVEVIRKVHVPVERPYEVIKKIHVPIEKRVEVPVAVWKPYPLHIIKHVTHYKKKSCCW